MSDDVVAGNNKESSKKAYYKEFQKVRVRETSFINLFYFLEKGYEQVSLFVGSRKLGRYN